VPLVVADEHALDIGQRSVTEGVGWGGHVATVFDAGDSTRERAGIVPACTSDRRHPTRGERDSQGGASAVWAS
jgi:hypothetical protein